MEVCQFVYCLLSRTRKISALPGLHDWEEYMDVEKVDEFDSISPDDFLRNHSFGSTLHGRNDGSGRTFREQCRKFMDRLVDAILGQQPVTGEFSQGLYAFCPELLLEGDDHHMLSLFSKLVRVLESSGCLSSSESRTAVEEYSTFVVDARRRHEDCGASAESVVDVQQYLLSDYSFLSRKSLVRVFKLCCLIALKPRVDYPSVDFGLTSCQVSEWVIASCISGVQSCVSASDFKLSSFFTKFTMKEVRDAIDGSQSFMSNAGYDPWAGICSEGQAAFVKRYADLFKTRVDRKRGEVSQQTCSLDALNPALRSGGEDDVSSAVLSDSVVSAASLPPMPSSSDTSSFRRSKTRVHSSLAFLLGRKKDASRGGFEVIPDPVSVVKKKSKKSASKVGGSSSKK